MQNSLTRIQLIYIQYLSFNKLRNKRIGIFAILLFFITTAFTITDGNPTANKLKTVVIDAGHGGKDPGAVYKNIYEKDIALSVALKLGNYISTNYPNVKVVYTRSTDEFIELNERARIANANKADLFISLHVNANKSTDAYGTETYILGLHRANENLDIAKRENSVILLEDNYSEKYEGFDPRSTESYIMFSLYQYVFFEQSIDFAAKVQDQFKNTSNRYDRGVKQMGLLVLARTTMPGVLVELGFLSNLDEVQYLISDEGKDKLALSLFNAFSNYKDSFEKTGTKTNGKNNTSPVFSPIDTTKKVKPETHQTEIKTNNNTSNNNTNINTNNNSNNCKLNEKQEIIFKIQIASSAKQITTIPQNFKDLKGVEEQFINGIYKYTIGNEKTFNGITELKKKVREKYPDAFLIAFKNGESIPVTEAINLLKK